MNWSKYKWAFLIIGILIIAIVGGVIENENSNSNQNSTSTTDQSASASTDGSTSNIATSVVQSQSGSSSSGNDSFTPIAIGDISKLAKTISSSSIGDTVELDGTVIKIWPDNEFEMQDSAGNVALIQVNGQESDDRSFMTGLAVGDKVAVDTIVFSSQTVGMTIGWSLDNNTEPSRTFPLAFFQLPNDTIYTEAPPGEISITYAIPMQELPPKPQPTWHAAFSYSGGSTKENTKPFFMQGDEWRITLICPTQAPLPFEIFFSANNYGVTDFNLPSAIFFNNYPMTDCPGTDVIEEHNQTPGYYTLDILPSTSYSIKVEDYY